MSTPNTHIGCKGIGQIMEHCREKEIFFLGAGGIMMSSLALLTKRAGYATRGSDRCPSALTKKLEDAGISVFYGHDAKNLGDNCGAVVYTVAVSPDNPEYAAAMSRGIPCISRADYLGYIMTAYRNRIGIAGMHGKSSCTSMCAQIFLDGAKNGTVSDPTIVSGAEYGAMGGAYYLGGHDNFIFEACEYMDSFLDFNPTVAVLLNAEMEHVDYFKSLDHICDSFARYAALVGEDGVVVYNADDENIRCSVRSVDGIKISFGLCEGCDFRAVSIECNRYPMEFDILYRGEMFTHVKLHAFGMHSVYNALAASAASFCCGIGAEDISLGLLNYSGAKRRMEYKGELCGSRVYDDYGHHPTEIGATLNGARVACEGKIICVFQPHTYSRTAALKDRFGDAFECADEVILADIYAARETDDCGIDSQKLAKIVGDKAIYGGDLDSIANILKSRARKGDMIIVMGAGDIFKIYEKLGM